MDQTFAPDFHEFGRSGSIHTRAELLLDNWRHDFEAILHDVTVRHLAPDIAHCTYICEVKTPTATEWANRSSLWNHTTGRWQLRFHQGTSPK